MNYKFLKGTPQPRAPKFRGLRSYNYGALPRDIDNNWDTRVLSQDHAHLLQMGVCITTEPSHLET